MRLTLRRAILVLLVAALPRVAAAQTSLKDARYEPADTTQVEVTLYELVLRDGSRLYGSIERQDDREVVFRTQAGVTLTASRDDIQSLRRVTGALVGGEFQRADPNRTRLFFGPTGRSLKQGETYLGVYEFLLPFVQVGVTDRVSIGGGMPLFFGEGAERPFWITPKVQVLHSGGTDVAVGLFHAFNIDHEHGGVAYAVGTRSGPKGSFTAGAGYAYNSDHGRAGVIMLGGERPVHRGLKFVTENYVWKGGNGIATAGVRFFGDHLSADLGLAFPIGADGFYAFPVVNFVRVF